MAETIVLTDDMPATVRAEILEARVRRLMAARARLGLTWDTRAERARMLGEIEDALEEWARVKPAPS